MWQLSILIVVKLLHWWDMASLETSRYKECVKNVYLCVLVWFIFCTSMSVNDCIFRLLMPLKFHLICKTEAKILCHNCHSIVFLKYQYLLTLLYLLNSNTSLSYSIVKRPHSFPHHIHLGFTISNSIRLLIKTKMSRKKNKIIFWEFHRDFIKSNQILSL